MNLQKIILLPITILALGACQYIPDFDEVLPDNRTKYTKSRSLPDLEVPPDLTIDGDDNLIIPGEAEPTTLTAYELQKKRGGLSELELLAAQYPGEKVLPVPGSAENVWPELIAYWHEKGYEIDLEDAELGVMETSWSEATTGEQSYREKFKIFAEPAEAGNNTILFVSGERQEKLGLGDENIEWIDQEADKKKVSRVVAEIKKIFYGDSPIVSDSRSTTPIRTAATQRELAQLENAGDDNLLLRLPAEFSIAWPQTEELLQRSDLFVEAKDTSKGIYYIVYTGKVEEKEEGWLDTLKFWGDDEPESKSYQLSLTDVEGKTEVIVLNEDGDWESGSDANAILNLLLEEHNRN